MTKQIIIATHNDHKANEIKEIFKDLDIKIVTLKDLDDYDEIIETEDTFLGNAALKAKAIAKKYHSVALADDSGLSIDALGGAPGVLSARYSNNGTEGNIAKVLEQLEGIKNRKAHFTCVICVAYPNLTTRCFEGRIDGTITTTLKGSNGFGYDPIFLIDGSDQTMAQIPPTLKNQISHRAKALALLKKEINTVLK